MITSLFGPLGAPGPLGLFAPDLNRLYQRHWGLEGSRKAKKWRRHTPDCSSQLTSHSLSPLWVSREAKAAIQAPSPLWYKKIAQIQASTGPEINFLTKPRPIPAFPPMGLGVSTKKRGFCDNFFRVKIVWSTLKLLTFIQMTRARKRPESLFTPSGTVQGLTRRCGTAEFQPISLRPGQLDHTPSSGLLWSVIVHRGHAPWADLACASRSLE